MVFVPRWQLGAALQQAVARSRGRAAGLQVTPLADYARSLTELALHTEGQTELDPGPQFFLTARVLHQLDEGQQSALSGDQPLSGMIAPLARTFATLRTHDVSPAAYRTEADGSARRAAQAEAFARYEDLLDQHDLYDEAHLFESATTKVEEEHVDLSATVWAVEETVTLSTVEHRFLTALRRHQRERPSLYRIGTNRLSGSDDSDRSVPPPRRTAAARFPDAPRPGTNAGTPGSSAEFPLFVETSPDDRTGSGLRFWTATGSRREVQAVFEDVLDRGRPLDTVEIAYTSSDPYLPLIDALAERYEIPVSLSVGRSIEATRPGQALRGFFDWIASGCPIPNLIGLLRADLIRVDEPIGDDHSGPLDSPRAAALLAEKRYPEDCRDYADTFAAWRASLESEADDIEEAADASWAADSARRRRDRAAAVRTLDGVVDDLLTFAEMNERGPVRPTDLASGAENLLEEYGPTPRPTGPEEERSADEVARNRLIERLQAIDERDDDLRLSPRRLARRMKTWLGLSPYVRARRPQPGRAHVVPLESAGYADRDHLYVVGLDASSTRAAAPDDPLLSDEEREALSDPTRPLPLRRDQADAEAWRTRHALARHAGSLTLSASTHDLATDEDLFEAPLYLRLKEADQAARDVECDAEDPAVTHHPLAADAATLLSDLDGWTRRAPPSPEILDDAYTSRFPWIQEGLEAAEARASETYTPYDGLLSPRSYPGLDPLSRSRPVSAGQLETYAQAPYAYFLRHVLEVAPREEPALDDVAWLDARGRGGVLHDTFKRFMAALDRRPTWNDASRLREVFDTVIEEKRADLPPPNEVVFASTRRQLWTDAALFLRAEAARPDDHTPHAFEVGFGYPPHRRADGDYEDAPLLSFDDFSFTLRGRIDRVDQLDDGSFGLWDYKTGSSRRYDEADLLGDHHLQWALYAYAFEALENETVSVAGYFFTSADEMGKRISASPDAHRRDVAATLKQASDGITAGAFPVTDADDLRYSFDLLFHDDGERRKQLTAKTWPDDRPAPPALRDE